ncbi:AsnC family protein [Thermoproteota archaeon]
MTKKVNKDRLLHELLKDSSRSDRQIAAELGVSQPTIQK